jgi:uncharacterized membrane protein YgdD (TMEM256/DUF423 family)
MRLSQVSRIPAALAGILGAAGIAAAALAAHGGYDENLRTASQFALIHAALVAALCLATAPTAATTLAAGVVLAGAGLFCGDLALHAGKVAPTLAYDVGPRHVRNENSVPHQF